MTPAEADQVRAAVRKYRFNSAKRGLIDGARRSWLFWAIFLVVVVGPSLKEDESMFALRLLTFLAGVFAAASLVVLKR
jgi:hypothetical protein